MFRSNSKPHILYFLLMIWFAVGVNTLKAQTTAFTYQGKLTDGSSPAAGNYDFEFRLFDALTAGTQQGD